MYIATEPECTKQSVVGGCVMTWNKAGHVNMVQCPFNMTTSPH